MRDWYDVYLDEISLKKDLKGYVDYKIKNKKKLINLIKKYSPNKKVMEAGCGTGIIATYLASLGFDVTEVDIDKKILGLAKKVSKEYINNAAPKFVEKDILKLDFKENEFDCIFSNGVLEHFSDKEIVKILSLQLEQARYVIVGIPTTFFDPSEALHGDERFLDNNYWRGLFKKCDAKIIEEESYDYRTFKEHLQSLNKIFREKPFKIFVLEKNE